MAEKLANTEVSSPIPEKHSMSLGVGKHIGVLSLRRRLKGFLICCPRSRCWRSQEGSKQSSRAACVSRHHVETLGGEENQGERDLRNQIVTQVWSRGLREVRLDTAYILTHSTKSVKHLPWAMFCAWDVGENPFEIFHSSRKVLECKSNSLTM